MAMNGNVMGSAMMAAVDALTELERQDRTAVFRAMAGAIVSHIASVGIAADPLMAVWQGQVETVVNGLAPGAVVPLAATFNSLAIVK